MLELSRGEARRLALYQLGLGEPRCRSPDSDALHSVIERLGQVQIDSVNVLVRAHYMPAFSRIGNYDRATLDSLATGPKRCLFEYWGHEASLIDVALQPLLRWRMVRARDGYGIYPGLRRFAVERRSFIDDVCSQVAERGPLTARELPDTGKAKGGWWGWSDGKRALEWLFWAGIVTTHSRRGFERVYDLTERVLPEVTSLPDPDEREAQRGLIAVAARALGVATARDLRDYWRIGPEDAARAIPELVETGELLQVSVDGWINQAYISASVAGAMPNSAPSGARLISPFDPLLWYRDRAERLLDFRYRIEIYTPRQKREYGYYVLPFLHGDRIVARVDLKADRPQGMLLINAAHLEAGVDPVETAEALDLEHTALMSWLGLSHTRVEASGKFAELLRTCRSCA